MDSDVIVVGAGWPDWWPPPRLPMRGKRCSCWIRNRRRRWADKPGGPSAGCFWWILPNSGGWGSRIPGSWPGRTGWAPRALTGRRTRSIGRSNGRRHMWTLRRGKSARGLWSTGSDFSRSSPGRSGEGTSPTATATPCPGFTSSGGPVRPWSPPLSGGSGPPWKRA